MALRNEKTSLPWHSQTAAEITAKLGVYPGTGLSARAAKDRLRRIGPNDVPHSGVASVFRKAVYSTLDLPLIFLLLTAAAATALGNGGGTRALFIISAIGVFLHAVAYIIARFRTDRYLRTPTSGVKATVIRDGKEVIISARYLVPGDIIKLKAGDYLTCDCRILSDDSVTVYEADVTGVVIAEKHNCTLPPETDVAHRANMIYAKSRIVSGECAAIVVETGEFTLATETSVDTEIMAKKAKAAIFHSLERRGRTTGVVMIAAAAVMTIISLLSQRNGSMLYDVFLAGLALAASVASEYYEAYGDITLTSSITALLKATAGKVRYKSSRAFDASSSLDVIITCVDGMIEREGISCAATFFGGVAQNTADIPVSLTRAAAVSCGVYGGAIADDTIPPRSESSQLFIEYFKCAGQAHTDIYSPKFMPVFFRGEADGVPFDTQLIYDGDKYTAFVNGSPSDVLPLCTEYEAADGTTLPMTEEVRRAASRFTSEYSARGYVVVAVAKKLTKFSTYDRVPLMHRDMCLVGMAVFSKPSAHFISEAIKDCQRAGIRVIIAGRGRKDVLAAVRTGFASGASDVITARAYAVMDPDERAEAVGSAKVLLGFGVRMMADVIRNLRKNGYRVAYVGNPERSAQSVGDEVVLMRLADVSIAASTTDMPDGTGGANANVDVLSDAAELTVPLSDDEGGGFPDVIRAVLYAKQMKRNVESIKDYLLASQVARLTLVISAAAALGAGAAGAALTLAWGLLFDFAVALTLAVERPDSETIMYRLSKKKTRWLFVLALLSGAIWGAVMSICTALHTDGVMGRVSSVAVVSLLVATVAAAGEVRRDRSILSPKRLISPSGFSLLCISAALIVLLTVSAGFSSFIGIDQPKQKELLLSILPAAAVMITYEISKIIKPYQKKYKRNENDID